MVVGKLESGQYKTRASLESVLTVRRYIPSRAENQKIRKRCRRVPRRCCDDAENRRINVIDRDRANIHKLGQVVFVRNVVSVPRHYVKGRMLLCAFEELATKLVDNLPRFHCDLVVCHGV